MTPSVPTDDVSSALVRVHYLVNRAQTQGENQLEVLVRYAGLDVAVVMAKPVSGQGANRVVEVTATGSMIPPAQVRTAMRRLVEGSGLPDDLLEYGTAASVEVANAMRRVVELVRWRCNASISNHPYEFQGAEFSIDGGAIWTILPLKGRAALRRPGEFRFDVETGSSIIELAAEGAEEPIAHHLLREALDISTAHPRSAIVIGMAAVEAGFKHLVQTLVPASAWLMEKVPSPPIPKMLSDYMPTLPALLDFDGIVLPPPRYARKIIVDAIEERNRVAHTGTGSMSGAPLVHALGCVQDLLYLFDYYGGCEWALEHISEQFRAALLPQP